jgi:hypothetical protein
MRRSGLLCAITAVVALAAPPAWGRGTVLRVEADQAYVDLGSDAGLQPGSQLRLYHAIVATHPVSKKKVRDTFYLGTLTVAKAGKQLAVAAPDGEDVRTRMTMGDEVELVGLPAVVEDPWAARVKAKAVAAGVEAGVPAPVEAVDPAEERARLLAQREQVRAAAQERVDAETAANTVFAQTLGRPPEERAALWRAYLDAYPSSPYAAAVRAEIAGFKAQALAEEDLERRAVEKTQGEAEESVAGYLLAGTVELADPLAFAPPGRVYEGSSFELSFLVVRPQRVRSAWAHYRRIGEETFRSLELVAGGDGYLRGRVRGDAVRAPALEYFVEVLETGAERPAAVAGSALVPMRIEVDASVEEPPPDIVQRSRVTTVFDYVDFDGFGSDLDNYWSAEVDFMYRFRKPIYAMRIGYGTMNGRGGPKDVIDEADRAGRAECVDADGVYRCHKVAFNYAYAELEVRLKSDVVSLMVRPLAGRGDYDDEDGPDIAPDYRDALGIKLRLRIGRERETNLALGFAVVDGFGKAGEAAFTWDVIPRFPIVLSLEVTDQPVPEDPGVRLIADVGWRGMSWVYPSVRVSYQARDIDHAGLGAGAALNFDW